MKPKIALLATGGTGLSRMKRDLGSTVSSIVSVTARCDHPTARRLTSLPSTMPESLCRSSECAQSVLGGPHVVVGRIAGHHPEVIGALEETVLAQTFVIRDAGFRRWPTARLRFHAAIPIY